jgi:hypothetical protein
MEIVPIEIFGIHVEVPFPAPLGFAKAGLDEFGARLCDPSGGISLRAEQFRLKKWDDLFGYEVSAHFFGDNGTLLRTADRVKLGIRNARTAGDWQLIQQMLVRFYTLMDFDAKSLTTLSTHLHARFPSVEERDQWIGQFSHNALMTKAAALGYVRIFDWEKEIRVLIEPSNVVPDAIFCGWDTQFQNDQHWESFLGSIPTMMENAANLFELGFEPFREKV